MRREPQQASLRRWAGALAGVGVVAAMLGALVTAAARRPLWFDELFSFYVAGLPTPRAVIAALIAGVDNGPPLDYLARHLCMRLLGGSPLAFRLPSILALGCSTACLWWIARRRLPPAGAAVAAALPLGTLAFHYGTEGRAYAAMLATASCSLWAWLRAIERPGSRGRVALLAAALAAGPLCHYYGVLNIVPVAVGEGVRTVRLRRASAPILAAIAVALCSLALLPPFARHAVEMKQHFWAHPLGWRELLAAYRLLLHRSLVPALALCALAAAPLVARALRRAAPRQPPHGAPPPAWETAACGTLALTLVLVWLAALVYTNAATERYGIAAVAGFALWSGQGVLSLRRLGRWAGWVAVVIVLAEGLATARETVAASGTAPLPAGLEQFVAQATGPVAVDSPLLFLPAYHYLPAASRAKLIYLTDREASQRHLGFDNDDIAIPNLRRIVAVPTEPYRRFVARQKQFYALALPRRYWLLAQLAADGARIEPITRLDRVEVFRVTLR